MPEPTLLPRLESRSDYFDFLDGYSVQTSDELYERRLARGLVKSYMLETVGSNGNAPALPDMFADAGLTLEAVDSDGLFLVNDPQLGGAVALLEHLDNRHPVIYTLLRTNESDPWVRRLIESTPWLDRLWLSAHMFHELWRYVRATTPPHRYTRIAFEYEAFFEPRAPGASQVAEMETEETEDELADDTEEESPSLAEEDFRPERRSSRFTLVDRVGIVEDRLPALQSAYSPLYSITQLRVLAPGRGGHDFYFDGKVTNRSDSFADHRQTVEFVLQTYRKVTEAAEERLWLSSEEVAPDSTGFQLHGSPVYLQFAQQLDQPTFDRFLASFRWKRSRMRLAGQPLQLGPTKAHIYGVDRHLWQPLMLEVTDKHITGMLPAGTCGNTVHRIVTNVQRFLDPAVQAWIGEERFESLVDAALPAL